MSIVAAVDIGYGNVKYSSLDDQGRPRLGFFPSVAPLAPLQEFGGGFTPGRNTVYVTVDGVTYKVGQDAVLGLKEDAGRTLNKDYPDTAHYLALFRGALAYLGKPEIDLLVTGLPVNYFNQYKDRLAARLTGEHPFPDGATVRVREARVMPQPLGGYLSCAIGSGRFQEIREANCLIVDVGFYTLDYLTCRGMQVIDERSGSNPGGMSHVLNRLAQEVTKEQGDPFSDINALDAGLRNHNVIQWFGEEYNFSHLLPRAQPVIEDACRGIANTVGSARDIRTIILVGGGARMFEPALRRLYPRNEVLVSDDAIYANVRGFQLAGDGQVKRRERR